MKRPVFPKLMSEMALHGEDLADLSKLLKLSIPAVSNRLTGKTNFLEKEIKVLIKHYGKDYNELFE